MLRIGLIGAGKHGQRYARHIREDFPDLRLVAIARRNLTQGEEQARALGCRLYTDYRELIEASDVDALVVVVPPALHGEIVGHALQLGKPVLLEKPAAVSLKAGQALSRELRRRPLPLMIAQTLRYNAVVGALLARRGEIGTIHSISLSQRFEPSVLPWIDDPAQAGGGIILHTGVHSFDLLRLITGAEAELVTCQLQRVKTRQTEDSFAAAIRFRGGDVLATVSGARTAPGRTGHIEVAGERGTFVGDHVLHQAQLVARNGVQPIELGPRVPTVREVLRHFVDALRNDKPMPIPFDEGLRAVAIAEACYRAAENGRAEPVETV